MLTRLPTTASNRSPSPLPPADGVIDASSGTTWGELSAYYASVSESVLSQLRERPVLLVRALEGVDGRLQTQTHAGARPLRDIGTLAPGLDPGQPPLLEIRSPAGLQSAVDSGAVELHTWNSTVRAIRKPDRIELGLRPGEGVGWKQLRDGAAAVHSVLSELGLKSFLKTSGAEGLDVLVPLMPSRSWQFVEQFAQALVAHLVASAPGRLADAGAAPAGHPTTASEAHETGVTHGSARQARERTGRVLVDGRRNGWGATAACAWSARARAGLGISVPVAWDELDRLTGGAHWTVRSAAERIAVVGHRPWEHYAASRQGLASAVKALGFEMNPTAAGTPVTPVASVTAKRVGPPTDRPGDRSMWLHDTPTPPESPPPPGPPPAPVTPEGDPIQPVTDPLAPGHPEPVREPPMTRPPAAL